MKTFVMKAIRFSFLLLFSSACQDEEKITPLNEGENFSSYTVSNLKLQIHYPDLNHYDSAYVILKNSGGEIKQKLILNNSSYIATGTIALVPPGDWKISTSFFNTIETNYQSLEKNAVFDLKITPKATDLISRDEIAFIKDGNNPINKSFSWMDYYYYQLYINSNSTNIPEGFLRLPVDPTNPFVEIVTFNPKWIYAYVDRSFYNRSLDDNSNYYQGGIAFEVYGESGNTYDRLDRDIIDTTSLAPGIEEVLDKEWNYVDCVVIVAGANSNDEILVYHVWDLRTSSIGRIKSSSTTTSRIKSEIDKTNRINRFSN
jgi:hypothetical protein